jgi:hypothetical protein
MRITNEHCLRQPCEASRYKTYYQLILLEILFYVNNLKHCDDMKLYGYRRQSAPPYTSINKKSYKNEITLIVLMCLREECRLRVFENKVLRRIFGPKRDEVTWEWRRLHNKELYALYSSPNIIWVIKSRRLRWAGHVARMGERRCAYRALVGKPEGKRPFERPRCKWKDNIEVNL